MAGVKAQGILANRKKEIAMGNTRSISDWVKVYKKQIAAALPAVMTPERFVRICQTALSNNPKLLQCSETSFIGAMMNAAQLGLEPNSPLGQAYLIPYWSNKKRCYECSFQLGYKGLLALTYRSGEVANCDAHEVYENDFFEYEYGLEPKLVHKPALQNRGEVICYYATWKGKNGGFGFAVMSKEDVTKHALKFSKNKKGNSLDGVWVTNFDAMAKKTVLIQALKYAPLSTELYSQISQDTTIKNFDQKASEFNVLDAKNSLYDYDVIEADVQEIQEEPALIEAGSSPDFSVSEQDIAEYNEGLANALEEYGSEMA